jgi:hypothetical protein
LVTENAEDARHPAAFSLAQPFAGNGYCLGNLLFDQRQEVQWVKDHITLSLLLAVNNNPNLTPRAARSRG